MTDNKYTNIEVYRKKRHMNIGVILFGVIFIYLAVTVLIYLTDRKVSVYEVREGAIAKDTAYTGLVLRTETVTTADADGYINYVAPETDKVGAKTSVYALSSDKLEFESTTDEAAQLSAEEQSAMMQDVQSFSENYDAAQYGAVYSLKNTMRSVLESNSSQSRQAQITSMTEAGMEGLSLYPASGDGIIVYSTDGFENTKLQDVTAEMITRKKYETNGFDNNSKIKQGDAIYKLVTEDTWTLAILLDDKTAQEMADRKSVTVRFAKDAEVADADFAIYNTKDSNLGFLTFDSGMIRYIQDRYLDIELILEDESGLKIPKSAVTTKKFFTVPEDYLTQGGGSKESGVLVDTGKDNATFEAADVYYRDNEKGLLYLSAEEFDEGTALVKPDSTDTYTLKKTKKLKGVYNINKGYALFRQVQILCSSDEYYIVASGSESSLSNYDHIALDGKNIREDDIVF